MTWPIERSATTYGERNSADEVIEQYELDDQTQKDARIIINERAREAPFNAFNAAHLICSNLVYRRLYNMEPFVKARKAGDHKRMWEILKSLANADPIP